MDVVLGCTCSVRLFITDPVIGFPTPSFQNYIRSDISHCFLPSVSNISRVGGAFEVGMRRMYLTAWFA